MSEANTESEFIEQITSVILEQISNEQFGVSELAEVIGMSRSNLLRKVQKETKLSASQFIRQVRLKEGMKLLRKSSLTVSEVSYKVGFSSTSYFIKCFREYFGHPPGEVGKRANEEPALEDKSKIKKWPFIVTLILVIAIVSYLVFYTGKEKASLVPEKSIAVLPFKNDSQDSSNLYFVNGLMESALSNLQKIEDLRVVSRTSVEKYRNSTKGIKEIADELNVSYLVEGSGQKIGDQVMLNIQLIEASSDKHLWAEQYNRKIEDIFSIQNEVAKRMTEAIKVIVTPEELAQIEKKPTENLEAYDFYLRALDPFLKRTNEGLKKAISLFEKAVELDPTFALAYADLAISYYFLDAYREQKEYTSLINSYADKALLYDAKSAESLVAKAFYYLHVEKYKLALPHLEKALEYNPNSNIAIQMLADHYARFEPNTAKYLEYALKGLQLNIAANDSSTNSYIYLAISNAFIQSGFLDEAIKYIEMSLAYDPSNYYAPYVRAFILYACDKNLEVTKNLLIKELKKDTTRLDLLQEVGKMYYFQKDYDSAFYYYNKFVMGKEQFGLSIYPYEDAKLGFVYEKKGLIDRAEKFYESYKTYCKEDESIYKGASMAVKHALEGDLDLGIEQLKEFSTQNHFQYWIILFYEMDPMTESLQAHPEFERVMQDIKDRFWEDHEKLKSSLREKGLIN